MRQTESEPAILPIEMTTNEVVDALLGEGMSVLKLVKSGKLLHVKSIRQDDVCKGTTC